MRTLLSLSLLFAVGCSKSEAPSVPSSTAPPQPVTVKAPPVAPAANPQDPIAQVNQAMAQMGVKPGATAVSWRDLVPLLPDGAGDWKAEAAATGESTSMGSMQVSNAKRTYKAGDGTANVQITDATMVPTMAMPFRMARQMRHDGSDGYNRPVDVAGQPGYEEWRASGKHGKVVLLVADRFLVEANADNQADTKALVELVGKIDLSKLSSLK